MTTIRRMTALAGLCIALLGAGKGLAAFDEDRIQEDLRPLQGTWKVIVAEEEGKSMQSRFEQTIVEISDSQLVFHHGEDDREVMTVRVNASRRPKEMDLTLHGDDGPQDLVGIYAVHGDEITLCYSSRPGGTRPGVFATREVPGTQTLLVLKRVDSPSP